MLLMFDHEGSGKEKIERNSLQNDLNSKLSQSGGEDRARAIVLEPELEVWIWSDSSQVDRVLGWQDKESKLRPWLIQREWLKEGATKPSRPKEALGATLREACKSRSASLYKRLAETVCVRRCTDVAFIEFCAILRKWFPQNRLDRQAGTKKQHPAKALLILSNDLVGAEGFEPPTSSSQSWRTTRLCNTPLFE